MDDIPKGVVPGFTIPLHRSLTTPILIGGAPRAFAIANGTLAAAVGLGLRFYIAGLIIWLIGHAVGVIAARHDPNFMEVLSRHIKHKKHLGC